MLIAPAHCSVPKLLSNFEVFVIVASHFQIPKSVLVIYFLVTHHLKLTRLNKFSSCAVSECQEAGISALDGFGLRSSMRV